MQIKSRAALLKSLVKNPCAGLSEDIFLFVSSVTPLINVDLLIKNARNHTLLIWREDGLYPPGWHIPGGIVRYKESLVDRINAVASSELGANIEFKQEPLAINEVIHSLRRERGHCLSLLFECRLLGQPARKLEFKKGLPKAGEWFWHSKCPDNLISVHQMYRKFIGLKIREKP